MPSFDSLPEIVGQILGFIAVIISFITFQFKSQKRILISQVVMICVLCVHYLLIGAYTAFAMNLLGIFRNVVFCNRSFFKSKLWPYAMCVLMLASGIASWNGLPSLLLIIGLVFHTYFLSMNNAQLLRITLLFTCPFALAYNIMVFSLGGVLLESMAMVSAIVGILRYRRIGAEESDRG